MIAMAGIAMATFTGVMDGAIANVALPTIAHDLHSSAAASVWVVNAFQLAVTMSLLPIAAIGDKLGCRRVFAVGFAVFTVASVCCALSGTLLELSLSRALQGMGAASMMALSPPIVRRIYPQHMLGRGVGLVGVFVALAAATGPTAASVILSVAHWPWLFAVNLPIGIVGLAVTQMVLPDIPGTGRRFDLLGALLTAASLALLVTGVDRLGIEGPGLSAAGQIVAALVLGALLVRSQLRRTDPILPVDLMRAPLFALSVATSLCTYSAQMMTFVALPFFLQRNLGIDAVTSGFLITPWPVALAVTAPIAGRLADRYPAGLLGGIGLAFMACGTMLLTLLPASPGVIDIIWRMAVTGFGFGLFQAPNNRVLIGSAPRNRAGAAGGLQAAARLFGQTMGGAVAGVIFGVFGARGPVTALGVAAGIAAVGSLVSMTRLRAGRRAPA
jgi:MFS transporter, DHA2 family, multidrug resistance protein